MIKNVYVIDSESWYWWKETKEQAEQFIEKIKQEDGQKDIRFTYSKCKINKDDKNDFQEIEVLKVYTQ